MIGLKKIGIILIAAVILLAGCTNQAVKASAELGQQFSLTPGQSASIDGEPFEVKFVEVISDSRCPSGVQCIWAGEASCSIEITYNDSTFQQVLTQSGSGIAKTSFKEYEMTFDIQPYPEAGQNIEKNDYRLQLEVNFYEVQPAPIHEVTVSIAKSNPSQMIVYIKGGLPDGCTTFNGLDVDRSDNTVSISVTTRHPKNKSCPAIYGFFEQTVNLGSDFAAGQTYTLQVNDYVTTFQYPI